MTKALLTTALLFSLSATSMRAGTFTSAGAGPSAWNVPATWTFTGDADGIPDADDDVTIQAGHTVTTSTTSNARHLTVNGTLTCAANTALYVGGNYTNNGVENGSGAISFNNISGAIVSGTGTFGSAVRYHFSKSRTIAAGTVISKTVTVRITGSVTNLGTVTMSVFQCDAGSSWINSTNATLTLRAANFMPAGTTFNASATGNTVILAYTTNTIPNTVSGYYNLTIAATTSSSKLLPANFTVAGNLVINALNTLSTNNFDLSVGGNLTVNGSLTPSAGKTITFNGTAAPQSITWPGTQTVYNIVVNNTNGVTLSSGTWNVRESLTATAGTFNAGSNTVTLLSDATSTARLGVTGATGAFSGSNYVIQRFISARNANWADLASPMGGTTLADWDNELYMSGVGGNDGNACCPIWYSVYNYDEASASYIPVTSTGTALTNGTGFEIYLGTTSTSLSATTMDTRGTPAFGDKVISVQRTASSPDPGWNLVGNPFASFIAWDNLQMTNLDATYYIFDNGTGTYAAYGAGTLIPPTQGFYVHSSSGSPTLTIPETAKSTSNSSTFLRTGNNAQLFTMKLKGTNIPFSHKAELYLDANATPAFEGTHDALYLKSPVEEAPAIYMMGSDNSKLVKNAFSATENTVNVPIVVMAGIDDVYTIETSGIEHLQGEYSCIMLEDRQENKMIDLSATKTYTFALSKGTNANRFVLHMSKNSSECERLAGKINTATEDVQVINSNEGVYVKFNLDEASPATISLYNVLGQEIMSTSVEAGKQTTKLEVPANLNGVYFVNVQMSDRKVTEKVFLKGNK